MVLLMRLLGMLSLVAMALVGSVVGVRLLRLAQHSRGLPEFSMALGLLLSAALGLPLCAVGRLPHLVATLPGDLLFGTGLAISLLGIVFLYVFTWRVFRPDSAWAVSLVFAALGVLAFVWMGLMEASGRGETMEEILPHTRPWSFAIIATVGLSFLWTGTESLAYYRRMRKRLALGLADPVVANRFFLWAVSGFAAALLCAAVMASLAAGQAPLRHPLPLALIGCAAVGSALAWYLAFLPPKGYVARIRRRAAA